MSDIIPSDRTNEWTTKLHELQFDRPLIDYAKIIQKVKLDIPLHRK